MHKIKTIIKNLLTEFLYKIQKNKQIVAKKPSDVYLSITDNCCLRCKMCDIWKLKEKQKDLDYPTAKKIIDKLLTWLGTNFQLNFTGGEPFLNKDFIKIINYANQKGLKTSTNSNAYIINNILAKQIINSGLTQIFFSLDGLKKEHNYIRGKKDSFEKVIKAIYFLQKNKFDKNNPKIIINTVISKNNLNKIKDIIYLSKKLNVSGINFQALMPNFASFYRNDWYKNNPFWPKNTNQTIKVVKQIIKLKNQYPDFILNSIYDLKKIIKFFSDPKYFQETETCFVGYNNFMINTTGNMRLCYEMDTIGNILKDNPQEIWFGKKAHLQRKQIIKCKKPCKLLPCNNPQILNWLKKIISVNLIKKLRQN